MNALVRRFFQEDAHYEVVLILSEDLTITWEDVVKKIPQFPRGWFELSRLPPEDRVAFTCDFWLGKFAFDPAFQPAMQQFFDALDDVGVVLVKSKDVWSAQMVYSLKDNSSFFRGLVPAAESDAEELAQELPFTLPRDWVAFTKIHNGFGKLSEWELIKIENIAGVKRHVFDMILVSECPVKSGNVLIDANSLIPFYEAVGLSSFQCFYADWYPKNEMGNVYFSGLDYTVSDVSHPDMWGENGAFPTFLEWFIAYLGGMSIAP